MGREWAGESGASGREWGAGYRRVPAGAVGGVGVEDVEAERGAQHGVGPGHKEAEEQLDDLVDADL